MSDTARPAIGEFLLFSVSPVERFARNAAEKRWAKVRRSSRAPIAVLACQRWPWKRERERESARAAFSCNALTPIWLSVFISLFIVCLFVSLLWLFVPFRHVSCLREWVA